MDNKTNTVKEDIKVTIRNDWDKTGAVTWTQRFKEIIDTALEDAATFDEFAENLKKENINVSEGLSKHGPYFVFYLDSSEKIIHRRTINLGEGYSHEDILTRIATNAKAKEQDVQEMEASKLQRERISTNRDYRPRAPKL